MGVLLSDDIGINFDDVSQFLLVAGGILAIIGATVIYRKWTSGKHDIEQDVMLWAGGVLALIIIQALVKAMFSGYT